MKFLIPALTFLAGCALQRPPCYEMVGIVNSQSALIFNSCTGNLELTRMPPTPTLSQQAL